MLNQAHCIRIRNATENNLQGISLDIPHNKFIVVTGVSGSGKSSLVFDVIANEGQRRYLETFASFSRLFMGKMQRPQVDSIEGLMPVISIGQHTSGAGIRSTLGTMSDLYDMLRLLYARIGKTTRDIELKRSLFSFNSPIGSCPQCKGIGLEEQIDIDKLITDPSKSLREGVLAPTLPNGYIMYSQVTIDVLNTVCNAHDFDVDTAWNQLSAEQQDVILNGSTRIKIPFGKHSLESRLKWTGITAKPREEGYYKGMIPIMTEILHRDRNENILKYVKSISCSNCNGTRLNDDARSVKIHSKNISALSNMELRELKNWLKQIVWQKDEENIALPIVQKMIQQISMFEQLGMGHLSLNRSSKTLTGGESQRIRLINQISAELSNVLYVFDEPSINMHPRNMQQLNSIFHTLVQQGNTVIVVEHDPSTIFQADWIIDIGPGAGKSGGKLLFNGPLKDFLNNKTIANSSPTQLALRNIHIQSESKKALKNYENITLNNCQVHNLKNIDVSFKKGAFNVVCGVAGSGKSSLVHGILEPAVAQYIDNKKNKKIHHTNHKGFDTIDKLIVINQSPIGRTPRSNPATYTKLSDKIRDIFAKQESAQTAGFTKSHFSFNNHGGRCETCMGAGRIQIGMHFLGNVDIVCSICNGKRFTKEVLEITYNGKNISEIYELTANQAIEFFADQKAIEKQLQTLIDVGLGYITLGQSSTTLSGGEAQRIKLASQLQKPSSGNTLYILNEPSVGLHIHDVAVLLKVFKKLINRGDTIICIENDISIISQADYVIELGPDSGENGGQQIFSGTPSELIINKQTPTALAIREPELPERTVFKPLFNDNIKLNGVDTHMLKHIDVSIPKNKLTVITGLSGTGKSSLAFDTLFAEARSRFSESMSTYVRTLLKQNNPAKLESCSGLCPTVAISRKHLGHSERSTVGTITGIYDHYRLLYSRLAQLQGFDYSAQHYSFNHQSGACTACDGIGKIRTTDPDKLISHPNLSIVNNAMKGTRLGKYYGDPYGRYIAIIQKIADEKGFDISVPWQDLNSETKEIILFGTGDTVWKLNWEFKNKTRSGEQQLQTIWEGFCNIIDDEYKRKHQNKNIDSITELMHDIPCSTCNGSRLKQHLLKVKCKNKNIAELSALSVKESISFFKNTISTTQQNLEQTIIKEIASPLIFILETLQELGLEYLSMHR
jgi:excinuclease ABC subunit A